MPGKIHHTLSTLGFSNLADAKKRTRVATLCYSTVYTKRYAMKLSSALLGRNRRKKRVLRRGSSRDCVTENQFWGGFEDFEGWDTAGEDVLTGTDRRSGNR